jgi:hypothetical protein
MHNGTVHPGLHHCEQYPVPNKGEIVTAILSSMAIPGVFTSVDYNSTKLAGGGYNNISGDIIIDQIFNINRTRLYLNS